MKVSIYIIVIFLFKYEMGYTSDVSEVKEALKNTISSDVTTVVNQIKNDDLSIKKITTIPTLLNETKDKIIKDSKDVVMNLVEERIKQEKKDIIGYEKTLIEGYLFSTLSLFAATLIAPQAIMVCKTKPSAIIYAGSAAFYIISEIANVKILKASQLAEIEVVSDYKFSKDKSLAENMKEIKRNVNMDKSYKENLSDVKSRIDDQIGYIKAYKKTLDNYFTALKKKARNAKIVSIGFLSSSVAAVAEQMDLFSGGGACVATHKIENNNTSKEYLVFSSKLDDYYIKSIDEAKKAEEKWAFYFEWESFKFGANRSMTWEEFSRLKNIPSMDSSSLSTILKAAIGSLELNFVANVFAASEKITVIPSLKNKKMADWYGDLDKLGIVGGAAVTLVAYISGWQMGFLKSIMASGTSRAITFGAQGALAYTAGTMFDKAADGFIGKMEKVDEIIDSFDKYAKKGIDLLVPPDSYSKKFQEIVAIAGVPSHKIITEMSIREACSYIEKIKELGNDKLNDIQYKFLNDYSDLLNKKNNDTAPKVEIPKSTSFINWILPRAEAASFDKNCLEKKSCSKLNFPKFQKKNMLEFNKYLDFYEGYYQGVIDNNTTIEEKYARKLFRNKTLVSDFRNKLLKMATGESYPELEKKKIQQDFNLFKKFHQKLSKQDQKDLQKQLTLSEINDQADKLLNKPIETLKDQKKGGGIGIQNQKDYKNNEIANKETIITKEEFQPKYKIEINDIHNKNIDLFEIIHTQYIKFSQNFLKE